MKIRETPFIGRKKELKQLKGLLEKGSASLVVLKGRRRIGKSRLIEEYGKNFGQVYIFSGLPPAPQTTLQDQLDQFGWQLGKALDEPAFKEKDWNDLFLRLARRTITGRVLILLDEISWMGSKDSNFLGKLKNAWDLQFKKNPQLIMVLCGSVSSWIEKNILSSTGFLGRISLKLNLEELPLNDCNQFWLNWAEKTSAYEKFKVLAITGGVPKYLEEIKPQLSAEENIRELCFESSGLLFNEFDQIFADIFAQRNTLYKDIVHSIMNGYFEYEEIYKRLGVEKSGLISEYLEDLITSGFLTRDYTWHLKTGKISKLSRFRISDNYLRFYLKYILPNKDKVLRNALDKASLTLLPQWEAIMGLQFENLVLHNRQKIQDILNIRPEQIVYDNPFFQHRTTRQQGCQIDYLIQTSFNTLYICEIKFSKNLVKPTVIREMQQKIAKLKIPRNFSYRSVLIHINGVEDSVLGSPEFSNIIDFSELLYKN